MKMSEDLVQQSILPNSCTSETLPSDKAKSWVIVSIVLAILSITVLLTAGVLLVVAVAVFAVFLIPMLIEQFLITFSMKEKP